MNQPVQNVEDYMPSSTVVAEPISKFSLSTQGYLLVTIAACTYGLQPFFAHFAYLDGANPVGLLLIRFLLAAVLVLTWLLITNKEKLPPFSLCAQYMLIGVGYAAAALGYYTASRTSSISLAVILMYSFPVFVTLFAIFFLKETISLWKMVSLLLALIGVVMAIGFDLQGDMTGVLWALFSALSYGSAILYGSHRVKPCNPFHSTSMVFIGGALTVLLASTMQAAELPQSYHGWLATVGLVLFATILPVTTFILGAPKIGASNASTLSAFEPVVAVIVAVMLVGEALSLSMIIGGVLVIIAAIILVRNNSTMTTKN